MEVFGITLWKSKEQKKIQAIEKRPAIVAGVFSNGGLIPNGPGFAISFDGEKDAGEMGPILQYNLDHAALTARGWQLFLDSDACQMVFRNFGKWVIGSGLKLQAEPQKIVLEGEGIDVDTEGFSKLAEGRWKVYANSKIGDYAGMQSLNAIQKEAHKNAMVGGDVLVILRLVKGVIKVQLIDGAHVTTPLNFSFGSGGFYINPDNNNRIKNGVEIDSTGRHVAYYVRKGLFETERITARDSQGVLRAYLVYGLKYRLDNVRGMPLITAVMESAKKLDRYKEAALGSAEEIAKIAYQIVHQQFSDGSNVLDEMAAVIKGNGPAVVTDVAITEQAEKLANKVAVTTNKMTLNMPVGSKVESIENKGNLYFAEFFSINIGLICATVGIPPDVALSDYKGSYSSSRAAIKDWEHTLQVERKDFSDQFLQPIYNLWLWVQVLQNKITAPGYLIGVAQQNEMLLEAYQYARFTGSNVPHIDPVKEVQAVRLKMGTAAAHIPLATAEEGSEELNGGDVISTMEQVAKELERAENLGIKPVLKTNQQPENEDEEVEPKKVKSK